MNNQENAEHKIILLEAYCPLVRNQKAKDKTLNAVADKYKTSTAQVLIRWSLQRGFISLPKSDTPSRIESNADVYSFELSKEDMDKLNALDQGAAGNICEAVQGVS